MHRKTMLIAIAAIHMVLLGEGLQAGSIWAKRSKTVPNLYSDDVARNIGDVLTIKIAEGSKVDNKAKRDLQKQTSQSSDFDGKLGVGRILPTVPGFTMDAQSDNSLKSKADFQDERSFTDQITVVVMDVLPNGLFRYGSNSAIRWDPGPPAENPRAVGVIETIDGLYRPRKAGDFVSAPWVRGPIVEIPVTVPDDLQLHDGWGLGPDGMVEVWRRWLDRSHRRGELFNLMFHPELAEVCRPPLVQLLREAKRYQPAIWIGRLRDIGDWWWERSGFRSRISDTPAGLRVSFACSARATILVRGIGPLRMAEAWDGSWFQLRADSLDAPPVPRPFVGVASSVPGTVTSFLRDQGYILDTGETAADCGLYLGHEKLAKLMTQVELVDWIEGSNAPLVKYGRWPDGAKSAFCMSGDLDALSLLDYVSRLFVP